MSARTFGLIWLVSIVLAAVFTAGIMLYPTSDSESTIDLSETPIPQAPIVVIGSSLMRSALPGLGSEDGDGILVHRHGSIDG